MSRRSPAGFGPRIAWLAAGLLALTCAVPARAMGVLPTGFMLEDATPGAAFDTPTCE